MARMHDEGSVQSGTHSSAQQGKLQPAFYRSTAHPELNTL